MINNKSAGIVVFATQQCQMIINKNKIILNNTKCYTGPIWVDNQEGRNKHLADWNRFENGLKTDPTSLATVDVSCPWHAFLNLKLSVRQSPNMIE